MADESKFYSNFVTVLFTTDEALLRFYCKEPEMSSPQLVATSYMPLSLAKKLSAALNSAVSQHEALFGTIVTDVLETLPEGKLQELIDSGIVKNLSAPNEQKP